MLKIEPPADRRAARRKTHRVRRAARARSQIAIYISTGAPECCVFVCQSQFRKAVTRFRDSAANTIFIEKRRSFPASRKNACAFLISRSDLQCFSHEDGCFAPEAYLENSLSELLRTREIKTRQKRKRVIANVLIPCQSMMKKCIIY